MIKFCDTNKYLFNNTDVTFIEEYFLEFLISDVYVKKQIFKFQKNRTNDLKNTVN